MTVKNPVAAIKARRAAKRYEAQIAASQAKLAETKLVPGYTRIYC
jgi:hypothetical protein